MNWQPLKTAPKDGTPVELDNHMYAAWIDGTWRHLRSHRKIPRLALVTGWRAFSAEELARIAAWLAAPPRSKTLNTPMSAGWWPIESAPQDGTQVDLWVSWQGREFRVADCGWAGTDEATAGWRKFEPAGTYPLHPGCRPTHWRSIPSGPGERKNVVADTSNNTE